MKCWSRVKVQAEKELSSDEGGSRLTDPALSGVGVDLNAGKRLVFEAAELPAEDVT